MSPHPLPRALHAPCAAGHHGPGRATRRALGRAQARGFGAVVAIVILVLLASLAAAITRLTWTQQSNSASDLASARALQAASAGMEWGMYQALNASGSWQGCTNSSQTLDLRTSLGVWVTVTCTANGTPYVEGATTTGGDRQVRVYQIDAVACNGATGCPDNSRSALQTYVERRRQAIVTDRLTSE